MWADSAIASGFNVAQKDFNDIIGLAKDGSITAPGGAKLSPAGFIVNCPIISELN